MQNIYNYYLGNFIRFVIVGIINTFLHISIYYFLVQSGINYSIAQSIAFIIVAIVSFFINKIWTFKNSEKIIQKQIVSYFVARLIISLIALLQTYILVKYYHLNAFICQFLAILVNIVFNYIHSQAVVFSNQQDNTFDSFLEHSMELIRKCPVDKKITCHFIVPLFNEQKRIAAKSKENPEGEDLVRTKIFQLNEFFSLRKEINWHLVFIDDADVESLSGKLVVEILQKEYSRLFKSKKAEVLFLSEINPEIGKLSKKGGAVVTAMKYILKLNKNPDDIIFYTDADTSSDLRLSGLLIQPITEGSDAAISSRWHPQSVVINRGLISRYSSWFFSILVSLILRLYYYDSQNGFKAFKLQAVKRIIDYADDYSLTFDTDLLLLLKHFNFSVAEIPIHWSDSSKHSNISMLRDSWGMVINLFKQRSKYRNMRKQDGFKRKTNI